MFVANIIRYLGIFLALFSLSMLPPMFVAWFYKENTVLVFLFSLLNILATGLSLWYPSRHKHQELHPREGFLIVVLFWTVFSLAGSMPFILSTNPQVSFVDALFESMSGITATGSTVFTDLANMPKSILFYRQQLQFIGGMGIILLAIAVLPALGVGGMQLFQTELTGPIKDNKLTPKITQTAKGLWTIYCGLAFFCTICYWAAGMEMFDAIGYSFGTVSTGGFTTHDESMGYYPNPVIQGVGVFFMIASAVNFALHFLSVRRGDIIHYWKDLEFRVFLIMIFISTLVIIFFLQNDSLFDHFGQASIETLYQVTSLATTTGMASSKFSEWPYFIPLWLLLLGIIGGCSGSTSGGIKISRFILLNKQSQREIKRLIHPDAHYVIKMGSTVLSEHVLNTIWGFLAVYAAVFFIIQLLLMGNGLNLITSFSATAATLSNIGPGLGDVANNYQGLNDFSKILLTCSMLIGRLELFTVLVLFTPTYWRT